MNDLLMYKLALKIEEKIKKDFATIHLSMNLVNTIKVEKNDSGYIVDIPAQVYDLTKWYAEKVIVYKGTGSYAQEVDMQGGFSKKHKDYIERAINESIIEWIKENNLKASVSDD